MPDGTQNFHARRSGGVRHLPEADIEIIRDIVKGYDSPGSILKELIQNAEDAEATHLHLLYLPAEPNSPLSLLRGPGLLVANDGVFKESDCDAIRQVYFGTKGRDNRAIGRFGKGLKSVFAWCEAFFILARTNRQSGWSHDSITDFFNPWKEMLRHQQWEEEYRVHAQVLFAKAAEHLASAYAPEKPWLAFWFPLRCQAQADAAQGAVDWLVPNSTAGFPGDDPRFPKSLCAEFAALVPTLVCLRRLQQLTISRAASEPQLLLSWRVASESLRIPSPADEPGNQAIDGKTLLSQSGVGKRDHRYGGIAGKLADEMVQDVALDANSRIKGEPHFAALISADCPEVTASTGKLRVVWSVFFPVGKQPPGISEIELRELARNLTVNLHGFFFLDSDRLRIDGLEEGFRRNGTAMQESYIEWNRLVATQGALAHLPQALATFAEQEALTDAQRRELAAALRDTWVWKNFQAAICQRETWRPRWREGVETWECLAAEQPALPIPHTASPGEILDEILARLPALAAISREHTLIARQADGVFAGLYDKAAGCWDEALVLRLLQDVQLSATGDEATACWLNKFLSQLREDKALTPAIYKLVADLPLLPVREARSQTPRRLSAREWREYWGDDRLFASDYQQDAWLKLLSAALPDWSCFVATDGELPRWFTNRDLPRCHAIKAANIVLRQQRLGDFNQRLSLFNAFANLPEPSLRLRRARRFLLHTEARQAHNDDSLLFMPPVQPQQQVWSRLIEQLLQKGGDVDGWRLLPHEWTTVLTAQTQSELGVTTVDATGVLQELMNNSREVSALEFAPAQWSAPEISTLLQGLYRAGEEKGKRQETLALLRAMPLHSLRGQANRRVSIAADDGELDKRFILNQPGFEKQLPPKIDPLWQTFLSETNIVERLPDNDLAVIVQQQLFQRTDANGTAYLAQLDWNYIVRHSLEAAAPCERAPLILEALSHGDQAATGIGQQLKNTAWLPLKSGEAIAPSSLVHIQGLEEVLEQLFDPARDNLAGIGALSDDVVKHPGFATLKKYLPQTRESLKLISGWLQDKPQWRLGLGGELQPRELDILLPQLENFAELPIAALLTKLRRLALPDMDSWLQELVLPVVLQPFDEAQKLAAILQKLQHPQSRAAFDAYLKQAAQQDLLQPMLSKLSLVNQRGEWVSARRLIWPSKNLDPAAQLCEEQAKILAPPQVDPVNDEAPALGNQQPPVLRHGNRSLQTPDFEIEATKLSSYLNRFTQGNIGENLPAALVAVLGGHPSTRKLLHELLQARLRQSPQDFLAVLLGEEGNALAEKIERARFRIELIRDDTVRVESVIGEMLTVGLASDITTLVVGNADELAKKYTVERTRQGDIFIYSLRLRWIEHPDELADAVKIFASTIETILLKAHARGKVEQVPNGLKEFLETIADAGQTDLRRSQLFLLDMAEARLQELGIRGVPQFDKVLEQFRAARQARVNAEAMAERNQPQSQKQADTARGLIQQARQELQRLLQTPQEDAARLALVEAVRRKMKDFTYNLDSIASELFQNADDAIVEWKEMRQGTLEPQEQEFVMALDSEQQTLEIIHWGRPINQHQVSGFDQGEKRGYDKDLEKMLTLNFSDKGVHTDGAATMVTGRFGLGFKSVFFVSQEPQVISGRLAFEIRGGFFPVSLPADAAKALREQAKQLEQSPSKLTQRKPTPTVICLRWSPDVEAQDLNRAIERFTVIAPLLTIFSREIRCIRVIEDGECRSWENQETELMTSRNCRATVARVGQQTFLCFHCRLSGDRHPASVLLQVDKSGITRLADDLTGLWITTPTAERAELSWALNAPFKPDAGRQRLALNNPENCQLADSLARAWGEGLVQLFDYASDNWESFARQLGLHTGITLAHWWKQFWKAMAGAPLLDWQSLRNGGEALNWLAWGRTSGAMRRLIEQRAAIPSELPGVYDRMLKQADVRFCVGGLLAELANGSFAQVAQWDSTHRAFPPGQTVQKEIGEFLRRAECLTESASVKLQDVFAAEVGAAFQASPAAGERFGDLFVACKTVIDESNAKYAEEVQQLFKWMKQIKLLAGDGNYYVASELVCGRELYKVIEKDEARRAAFAPASAILAADYSDTALAFFVKTRGQLQADTIRLASWARTVVPEQLPAVFTYLLEGDLRQQLAEQLKRSWLESKKTTQAWQQLSPAAQSELERLFAIEYPEQYFPREIPAPPPPEPPKIQPVMEPAVAFRLVSAWWEKESAVWVTCYGEKTYPHGFPGALPFPGEDGWEAKALPSAQARWLMLFIHAALAPLGFNNIGRDRSFLQFLVAKNWLEVLAGVTEQPEALLAALDDYLGAYVENTQHHFQMRQFIAFYTVANNLESVLSSLQAAERSSEEGAFSRVFSPNANPALSRTGIYALPLTGMLGIGSCQLLRELYRLERLKNPLGYRFAFTPIRKVRRLCAQLFAIPQESRSEAIFRRLEKLGNRLGLDPTFQHCFDLPLQFLAQDKALRTKVLQLEFETDDDDYTLDEAPNVGVPDTEVM